MYLMCKAKPVLQFNSDREIVSDARIIDEQLLPEMLKIKNGDGIANWLQHRSLDLTRSNGRMLAKLLGLNNNEMAAVLFNRALNLTDGYWIKASDSDRFGELCLYRKESNVFIVNTSLSGIMQDIPKIVNTELTNIGSFNKAWMKAKDQWWLYKRGTVNHFYSELFTYELGKELGMEMAKYKMNDGMITSLNFTNENAMLEHYDSFRYKFKDIGADESIVADNLSTVGLLQDYLDILLLDAIVCNPDRHNFNFGVLKDALTGKIISLAPNYDNNLALIGTENGLSDYLIKDYLKNFGIQVHQKKYIEKISFDLIKRIDAKVQKTLNCNVDSTIVTEYFGKILMHLGK